MNPTLAAIACIAFIAFVFYKNKIFEERIDLSFFIPLIWILYCSTKPISCWLYPGASPEDSAIQGSVYDRYFLSVIILAGIIVLKRRNVDWNEFIRQNIWVFLLFSYMGISIIWSNYIDISFRRWIRTLGDVIMATIIVTEKKGFESVTKIIKTDAFIIFPMTVLFVKYFPHIGVDYDRWEGYKMYIGLTTHKNDLGEVTMILGLVFLYNILRNFFAGQKQDIYDILFMGMTIWILIGPIIPYNPHSQNKTSVNSFLISSLFMIFFILFLKRTPRRLNMFVIFAPIVFVIVYAGVEVWYGKNIFEVMVYESGREMTLAGRTGLWKALVEIGSRDPLLGKGFGGFWLGQETPEVFQMAGWKATTGHSGYLDVFVDLGAVGLTLLLAIVVSNYRKITRLMTENFECATFLITYLCCIMVHNLTESSFIKPTNILWLIFLTISLMPAATYVCDDESENIGHINAFYEP